MQVTIRRQGMTVAFVRAWRVSLNGHTRNLYAGRSLKFDTESSEFELAAVLDWGRPSVWTCRIKDTSHPVEIDITDGTVLSDLGAQGERFVVDKMVNCSIESISTVHARYGLPERVSASARTLGWLAVISGVAWLACVFARLETGSIWFTLIALIAFVTFLSSVIRIGIKYMPAQNRAP